MKSKVFRWSVILILVAGVLGAPVWWWWRPQTITLSSGARLTLIGVTYGQHHVSPVAKSPTMPHRLTSILQGTNDFLIVWIRQRHKPQQLPAYQLFAYDADGTACVGSSGTTGVLDPRRGDEVVGIRFDAFPRRQRKFNLRIQEWNPQQGQIILTNAFVISNPARGPFPTWYPDSLPDTQSDGDLDVTLTKLTFGAKYFFPRNGLAPDDPLNKCVIAGLDVEQNGHAAASWRPVRVVTYDATGNHVAADVTSLGQDEGQVAVYQFGLWSNEPAWKVCFEFSHQSDFGGDELWTATAVPIEPGPMQDFFKYGRNRAARVFAETTMNGMHLKIYPAVQFQGQARWNSQLAGGFEIMADRPPAGVRLTLVKVTDDQGREIPTQSWNQGGNNYRFNLNNLGDAKTLNITLAVPKSRFVTFTAQPVHQ